MVDVTILSRTTNYSAKLSCAILENITSDLPHWSVNTNMYKIPSLFILADPDYHKPASIDLLIGADLFFDLMLADTKVLGVNLPILQGTKLGYIVSGQAPTTYSHHVRRAFCSTSTYNVDNIISRFWQLEEVTSERMLSPQERLCETLFIKNTVLSNNQYTVHLPFIDDTARSLLGGSFNTALRRFYSLERRLMKDNQLYTGYKKFIREYVELGHAEHANLDLSLLKNDNSDGYFLPHHPVMKESSHTTKLRVVFDASSKTTSGYSLNDILLTGSTVQPELFDILCRYRTHRYVLNADIQKMYRGVRVAEQDTNQQRILWRDNVNDPLGCITLTTVTYVTSAAPFLATRCLVKLASDEAANYPLAAAALLCDTYIDDILSGSETISGLAELKVQLINLLALAGFKLHKWFSNQPSVISDVTSGTLKDTNVNITDSDLSVKTLGLSWSPTLDTFQFTSPQDSPITDCTKRNVLSFIGKIFDPLGLVGPIVVQGKLLLQQIWSRKLGWDDALPPDILAQWLKFENNILHMTDIAIPRWIFTSGSVVAIELHAFSDASQRAYGTAAYFRVLYSDRTVSVRLICAKSRVAPLKTITLPRLELCGALLMARLIHRVINIFNTVSFSNVCLWTDSSIVLHWLNSSPSRWNTFIANRVSEIQELTHNCNWLHVRTADNPSDLLSRGTDPPSLQASTIWWEGPEWLGCYEAQFVQTKIVDADYLVPEERKITTHVCTELNQDFSRFSNFSRLLQAVAYCLRFAHNARPKNTKLGGSLTTREIENAHNAIIRIVQHQSFSKEITLLTKGLELTKSSIKMLNPFVDGKGMLRVSSRLQQADIQFDQKYPLILPQRHCVTDMIIRYTHFSLLHAGTQAVLSHLRLRYWPLNGKRQVKKIINKCVICFRHKAITSEQLMGALPADRVRNARPFSRVGIDYGGPFLIRQSRLRKAVTTKAYMALFVCMVTKAIHIELVSNMETETFLLALKRFISRRGKPSVIFSDNGRNFVGANNQLRELYHLFSSEIHISRVQDEATMQGINWKFIPPHSPHWGGIWEAGIKSAKYHIKRLVGNLILTFEELSTVFTQIEAILNSRPLCQLSNDPNDLAFLSPGHFLIHAPLTSYPEPDVSATPVNRLSFWQQCTQLQQQFSKRWHVEYLNQLQNRPRWLDGRPNVPENALVLLKEDNTPPLQWPLARVVKIIPGRDGRVRVAEVKTQTGIYTRPITKLCVLPLD